MLDKQGLQIFGHMMSYLITCNPSLVTEIQLSGNHLNDITRVNCKNCSLAPDLYSFDELGDIIKERSDEPPSRVRMEPVTIRINDNVFYGKIGSCARCNHIHYFISKKEE